MERWRDGEMERWRDGEMERWRDGEMEEESQFDSQLGTSFAAYTTPVYEPNPQPCLDKYAQRPWG
jgi:hypothetical protein